LVKAEVPLPTVNIYEAKTQLSRLVDLAASGTGAVIARAGKPVARLTGLNDPDKPKRIIGFGTLEGKGWIAGDLDDPLPDDLQALFEGRRCVSFSTRTSFAGRFTNRSGFRAGRRT
jgi:antitoxin (DNA-binding transcriptional repressor) of toxin-antitoxin stability system